MIYYLALIVVKMTAFFAGIETKAGKWNVKMRMPFAPNFTNFSLRF